MTPLRSCLKRSGMLVTNDKGRTYDRFRERVMFPIQDQRGRVIAFGGRVLVDDKPKYLNSPETPVFQNLESSMVCGRRANTRVAWSASWWSKATWM